MMRLRSHTNVGRCIFSITTVQFLLVAPAATAAGLGEHALALPSMAEIFRVLTLQDYNTRVVIIGTTLLGLAAGLVGTFLILRKRALLSDTLSHATLPGIALTFILMTLWGGNSKNLLALITGAAVFSILGTGSVMIIQRYSRLKDDAALGIVLSVFFGLGIALLGIATRMESGNAAGLTSFIYGKTASMLFLDALLIALAAGGAILFCMIFFKEFTLVSFDQQFASSQGWPVAWIDFFMMALVVTVTVIGLQAVGLILVVALLIIPPAAARFWTHQLNRMMWLSGAFGAAAGMFGATVSALMANLPAGAVIVLMASTIFLFSLALGSDRGLLKVLLIRIRLQRRVVRENLLRALYEISERHWRDRESIAANHMETADFETLLAYRTWSARRLHQALGTAVKQNLVRETGQQRYELTDKGRAAAFQVVRKHRLWETYLLTHADIAPSQVDFGADKIEHILDQSLIKQLEAAMPEVASDRMPPNPHQATP